jgi:hypothetical protein
VLTVRLGERAPHPGELQPQAVRVEEVDRQEDRLVVDRPDDVDAMRGQPVLPGQQVRLGIDVHREVPHPLRYAVVATRVLLAVDLEEGQAGAVRELEEGMQERGLRPGRRDDLLADGRDQREAEDFGVEPVGRLGVVGRHRDVIEGSDDVHDEIPHSFSNWVLKFAGPGPSGRAL